MSDISDTRDLWDREAQTFDEAADHGLADPDCREAWRALLLEHLPPAPARVADLGCGTGTLSLLLSGEGYAVDGLDLSPEMVRRAQDKAGHVATFVEGDASRPPLEAGAYDVVLSRHVLWAMPSPAEALGRWIDLLRPGGRLLLVEGNWVTGAGLSAEQTVGMVEATGRPATLRRMPEPVFWGREITDDRYLVVSTAP
ncbi:class I SAM-dependent methyltransferase [Nocardioides aestuarii]|uniref:Class I SAM-dependent methyltransferase n=1 Tax=Nocardioides aestuarii TaxID=252231 RepID=A0ABW4TQA8_9ACTN